MPILYFFSIWFIFACNQNPWQDIYDQEIAFRQALIQGNADITLAKINSSAPILHSPRIIIRKNSIEFDNRAWWLSSPDVFFLDNYHLEMNVGPCSRYECQKNILIEERVLDLEDGYIREEDKKDMSISKLLDVLEIQKEQHLLLRALYERLEVKNGEVVDKPEPEESVEELEFQQEITSEKKISPENIDWMQELEDIQALEKVSIKRKRIAAIAERNRKRSREEIIEQGLHDFRFTGTIQILVDEEVPYETVANVLFNVMQTEYSNCLLVGLADNKLVALKTSAREWNEIRFYNGHKDTIAIQSNRCDLISNGDYYSIHCENEHLYEPSHTPYFIQGETCEKSSDWRGLLNDFLSFQNSCFENAERSPQYTVKTDDVDYIDMKPMINDAFVWFLIPHSNDTFGEQIEKIDYIEKNFPQWAAFHYPLRSRINHTTPKKDIQKCSNMIDISNLSDDARKVLCHIFFEVGKDIPDYQSVFPELHAIRMKENQRNSAMENHKGTLSIFGLEEGVDLDNFANPSIQILDGKGVQIDINNEHKEGQ